MRLPPLVRGRIVRRYQRFLADVILDDGTPVVVHCPNTGSMASCWRSGAPVELSRSDNPRRRLPWTLERVDMGAGWVGVNTARVNAVVGEGIAGGRIPALCGYRLLRREPRYDVDGYPGTRFDFALGAGPGAEAFVEVKNTTLLDGDRVLFPDAVTERGRRHLELLAHAVRRGYRGVVVFAVNRPEGRWFEAAAAIDPRYADCLETVARAGVEVIAVRLRHDPAGIEVGGCASWAGR